MHPSVRKARDRGECHFRVFSQRSPVNADGRSLRYEEQKTWWHAQVKPFVDEVKTSPFNDSLTFSDTVTRRNLDVYFARYGTNLHATDARCMLVVEKNPCIPPLQDCFSRSQPTSNSTPRLSFSFLCGYLSAAAISGIPAMQLMVKSSRGFSRWDLKNFNCGAYRSNYNDCMVHNRRRTNEGGSIIDHRDLVRGEFRGSFLPMIHHSGSSL